MKKNKKINVKIKSIQNALLILIAVVFSLGVGYKLGENKFSINLKKTTPKIELTSKIPGHIEVNLDLFWLVWQRVSKDFFDKEKINPQVMVYGAIKGMVASLEDPYTIFLDPQENKKSKDDLLGQFEGIGAQLGLKDNAIVVVAPLEGTPAYKAGLVPGDIILKVDGQDTYGWSLPEAVDNIRGEKGTEVILTILHPKSDKSIDIPIIRNTIEVNSVETKVLLRTPNDKQAQLLEKKISDKNLSYIRLNRFGDDTNLEWDNKIKKIADLYSQGKTKGLILDLRSNPGGYLSGAIYIASEFIDKGVIVKQKKSDGSIQTYQVAKKGQLLKIPLVVLVNEGSASASEIVAGALKDHSRATLIGKKTFGKGSIQESIDLAENTGLHVTTAKWILPEGDLIDKKGIEPDIEIDLDEDDNEKDPQLEKAIEYLGS